MQRLIELKLKILAKMILAKYKPKIIGITGSVGKTSVREAIYTVLKEKHNVRRSIKNYNNELGVPLTIINATAPGKNIFGWVAVFFCALKLILFKEKNYPEILVLEMGVDKPGDMDYLNSIVKCQVGVLTMVGTVHAEYFKSREQLRQEKAKLIKAIPSGGWAIANYDNIASRKSLECSAAQKLTYGLDEQADVRADKISYDFGKIRNSSGLAGVKFRLSYKRDSAEVTLPGVFGPGVVYSGLAAAAVGISQGETLGEIALALKSYESPKGRMRVIDGIKRTIIFDDSYNAEPKSMRAALGVLKRIPLKSGARKFAVLGDMLELGKYSEQMHQDIGKYVFKCGIDKLIVVGERARDIARGAKEVGMKRDNIFNFADSVQAGRFLQDRIKEHDLILVKGSQGVRMEKIVLEIMADPQRAKELLVRQDKSWVGK